MEASAVRRPIVAALPGSARVLRLADDDKLVGFVRSGSQAAFEVVYDRHHRGILSFCRHMLGNQHEAEDALQHTFMAAYRDLVGSDKDIQLRAWLYTIARNRCLSVLRARRERPVDEMEDIPTEGLADAVQRRQDLQDMLRDLALLPDDQREALVLAEIGAMPHDEIAAVIGCPKEKVKALVFQARSSLHASREARDTDCSEIRELLANLRGGSLRRTQLKRHLKECAGCKAFAEDVKRQRKALAAVLPVVPAIGLKEQALAAAFGQSASAAATTAVAGSGAAAGAAALGTGSGAGALVAKGLVIAAVATGGVAGGVTAVNSVTGPSKGEAVREATPAGTNGTGPQAPLPATGAPVAAEPTPDAQDASTKKTSGKKTGKENALERGKGAKRGLRGTQPGKSAEKRAARQQRKAEREQRKAAKQQLKKTRKKKAKAKVKAAPPVKPVQKAKPTPTPRAPKATPTPEPTPAATTEPTVDPTPKGNGGQSLSPGRSS